MIRPLALARSAGSAATWAVVSGSMDRTRPLPPIGTYESRLWSTATTPLTAGEPAPPAAGEPAPPVLAVGGTTLEALGAALMSGRTRGVGPLRPVSHAASASDARPTAAIDIHARTRWQDGRAGIRLQPAIAPGRRRAGGT